MKTFPELFEKLKALYIENATIQIIIGLSYDDIGDGETDLYPLEICLQVKYNRHNSKIDESISVSVNNAYYWWGDSFNFKNIEGSTYGADFVGCYCSDATLPEIVTYADFPENWDESDLPDIEKEIGKILAEFLEIWQPEVTHCHGVSTYIESM